jgi:ribosome-associated protein
MTQQTALDAAGIAQRIVDELSDKQVENIVLLDVSKVSSFTDYFVIGTATSERQMKAVMESLERTLEAQGVRVRAREGRPESGWVLLDFGDVIVHLFSPDARAFYRLDDLWSRVVPVVRFT